MAGSKLAASKGKSTQNATKEKLFHPLSRKANQLERASLRKDKLASASSRRSRKQVEKADRFGFFFHAMPPDVPALTLPEYHELIRDLWLKRHDSAIQKEAAARRKGRPPSSRELELREQKLRDEDEYRTGLEVPDLTHEPTVELLRKWDTADAAYLHLLRFIRIAGTDPSMAPIVRYGLQERSTAPPLGPSKDVEMDSVEQVGAAEALTSGFPDVPVTRFSSTMQTMDDAT